MGAVDGESLLLLSGRADAARRQTATSEGAALYLTWHEDGMSDWLVNTLAGCCAGGDSGRAAPTMQLCNEHDTHGTTITATKAAQAHLLQRTRVNTVVCLVRGGGGGSCLI